MELFSVCIKSIDLESTCSECYIITCARFECKTFITDCLHFEAKMESSKLIIVRNNFITANKDHLTIR